MKKITRKECEVTVNHRDSPVSPLGRGSAVPTDAQAKLEARSIWSQPKLTKWKYSWNAVPSQTGKTPHERSHNRK